MLWLLFLPSVTCDNNPCENNGDCDEKNGGYECVCGAGYSGTNCEIVGIIISVLLIICKILLRIVDSIWDRIMLDQTFIVINKLLYIPV
jgi:hypothetical protein